MDLFSAVNVSQILGVAVGLVFVFLLVSLFVSWVQEGDAFRNCLEASTIPEGCEPDNESELTAYAVSFGSSFWFDILSKVVNMRLTGKKPKI